MTSIAKGLGVSLLLILTCTFAVADDSSELANLVTSNSATEVEAFLKSHPGVDLSHAADNSLSALQTGKAVEDNGVNSNVTIENARQVALTLARHGADFGAAYQRLEKLDQSSTCPNPNLSDEMCQVMLQASHTMLFEMGRYVNELQKATPAAKTPASEVDQEMTGDCHAEKMLPGPQDLLVAIQKFYRGTKRTGERQNEFRYLNNDCDVLLDIESRAHGRYHDIESARVYVNGEFDKRLSDQVGSGIGLRPGSYDEPAR